MKSHFFILFFIFSGFVLTAKGQTIDTALENKPFVNRSRITKWPGTGMTRQGWLLTIVAMQPGFNWFGAYYVGRPDIEAHYRATHNSYFKPSHYYTRAVEDITYLKPDVAVVHVRTGLTDDARYPGETFEFRRTIVLTKQSSVWLIKAGQNAKLEKNIK